MDDEEWFLETLRDLEESIASREYKVSKSSGLLRQLLVDDRPLVHRVNRTYGLRLYFRISSESPFEKLMHKDEAVFWSLEDLLDGESPQAYQPFNASLDQFLGRKIMRLGAQSLTVLNVIDYLANNAGGVHRGDPKNDRQKATQQVGQFFIRGGLPGPVHQVKLIGRITLRGLSPLHDAIVAARSKTNSNAFKQDQSES